MLDKFKRYLIGKPLKNEALGKEKYSVLWGLPILASDAISSVAYASEEILIVLVPAIGILAYQQLTVVSAAIIGLLILLTFSYRQTIDNYPNGGGAYIVAKDNLGEIAGVTAGAALSIDYIMTVAVSISSGVAQITSSIPPLIPYTVPLCVLTVILLMLGNLRGIRESSKLFSLPAYAFVFAILTMLIVGVFKYISGVPNPQPDPSQLQALEPVSLILLLRAFSSGCTALTGVEAVSNAVPNFREPTTKHAKTVLLLLSLLVFTLFGGISILVNLFHVIPGEKTVLAQIAYEIFGNTFMFYFVTISTFVILSMAANTSYADFPQLVSVMAREGHAPRQLSMRGDRLSFSNGIISLSVIAIILIVVFQAKVTSLIGLYAVGVFISFTLSQIGMCTKWVRQRGKNWVPKALINGFGGLVTGIAVVIIAATKFTEGSWIVIIVIPLLVISMMKIKKHYTAVAKQLRVTPEELASVNISHNNYRNRVIVPIESVNKASIRALRYAKTISDNVVAFNVSIDEESGAKVADKYHYLNTDIPIIVRYSPYRKVVEPLLEFIKSEEYDCKKGDIITVILPQFEVRKWWNNLLHNHTRVFIERELLKHHEHIVISVMPLQLKDDVAVLKQSL